MSVDAGVSPRRQEADDSDDDMGYLHHRYQPALKRASFEPEYMREPCEMASFEPEYMPERRYMASFEPDYMVEGAAFEPEYMVERASFEPERMREELSLATCEPAYMQEEIRELDSDDDIHCDRAAVETLCMEERIPEPTQAETQKCHAISPDIQLDDDISEVQLIHTKPLPSAINTEPSPSTVDNENNVIQDEETEDLQQRSTRNTLTNAVERAIGILDVPVVLIFGIILYLVDVGSDVAAGVSYFQQGHLGWGSLTIGIVLLSAVCWASISWTWWWYNNDNKTRWYYYVDRKDEYPAYRRKRMLLSLLLLDPLFR